MATTTRERDKERKKSGKTNHRTKNMRVHFHTDGQICPSTFGEDCPNDSDLYNSLIVKADKLPKFESMTHKVLKKLAALSGNKTSLPKVQLIIVLTKAWEKLNAEKKNLEEETSCPICFLDFTHKNVCVTKCGHKFCLECILTHHKRKNDCPLCRAELCKEIKKVRPKSAPRSSASTIETVPIIRQYSQPLNTERLWNNYGEWEDDA